ncbi:sigma-70 family RNA polymerase sigma factor [Adhaeribacter swui]|uniref:Sigma-70 family RNA polymerase sigma factor n=1 Tax=Adhaeribacter swui TaxID=2086471 RepID=A0A7G7G9P8_9BACT|nr:sigma-70 family RNA polymerase sigma factor [Adhaeribacter swui]QNF33882.1 sigma-70 family RNA polymerase sigma factor [Adhaeribacter swui]
MDLQTFKQKVLPTRDKLFRLAKTMLRHHEEAEDALQEVFLKLWSNQQKLEACQSVEAFAMTVTKNLCLDKLKVKAPKHLADVAELEIDSGAQSPHVSYELSNSAEVMRQLVDQLPEQQKLILHLRDVEGYSFEEIEQITQLPINTIRVNLSRARKWVRERYLKIEKYEVG